MAGVNGLLHTLCSFKNVCVPYMTTFLFITLFREVKTLDQNLAGDSESNSKKVLKRFLLIDKLVK